MLMLFRGQVFNVEDIRDITDRTTYALIDYKSGGFRKLFPAENESTLELIECFWHKYDLMIKERCNRMVDV